MHSILKKIIVGLFVSLTSISLSHATMNIFPKLEITHITFKSTPSFRYTRIGLEKPKVQGVHNHINYPHSLAKNVPKSLEPLKVYNLHF